jgi:hypothetical protein
MDVEAGNALAYSIIVGNKYSKTAFGKPRCRWENTNFTVDLGGNGLGGYEPDWDGT